MCYLMHSRDGEEKKRLRSKGHNLTFTANNVLRRLLSFVPSICHLLQLIAGLRSTDILAEPLEPVACPSEPYSLVRENVNY